MRRPVAPRSTPVRFFLCLGAFKNSRGIFFKSPFAVYMKINQLFRKKVDIDTLMMVMRCFGLTGLTDKRSFCRSDLMDIHTVTNLHDMVSTLEEFYMPCKSKVYLENLTEKRAITVLKQMLRIHGYFLASSERNSNNRKVIYYRLMNEMDIGIKPKMNKYDITQLIDFS